MILVNLVLSGLAIAILLKTFQMNGYDGDLVVLSVITISSPIILCILLLGELIPRYKPGARHVSRFLILFCVLTMIANNITLHV